MSAGDDPAKPLAGTPGVGIVLSDENSAWVHGRDVSPGRLVTVERLRHERPELVRSVHEVARQDAAKAKIIRYLVFEGENATVGYDELTAVVDVARRTVRYHVEDLAERGVVGRTSLGPSTAVEWADEESYIVASDVFALYER